MFEKFFLSLVLLVPKDHFYGLVFFQSMIDGAAFIGVGFDGRGEYSPESRKMSIVQRNCKNKAT